MVMVAVDEHRPDKNDKHEFSQAWILDVDGVRLVIHGFAPKVRT